MALVAMIVSVLALAVSIYEAQIMRAQQQIMLEEQHKNVWPYIQKINSIKTSNDEIVISLDIQNVGVGPALINKAELEVQGASISSYDTAFKLISDQIGIENILGFSMNHSFDGILSPGETESLFQLKMAPGLSKGWDLMPLLEVCFCSIYDDCYQLDKRQKKPILLTDVCQ